MIGCGGQAALAAAMVVIACLGLPSGSARAESCVEKGQAAARACMADPTTPENLRVKLRMSMNHEDLATAVENVCILRGEGVKDDCEKPSKESLRDRLRRELDAARPVVERIPEPAVSGCPPGSTYCYKVFMGGGRCEIRRRDGKELETDHSLPVYYDGRTRSIATGLEKCPLEYICIFYETFGAGRPYPGCDKPERALSVKSTPPEPPAAVAPPPAPAPSPPRSILSDPDIEVLIGLPPTSPRAAAPPPPAGGVPKAPFPAGKSPVPDSTITGIESDRAKRVDPGAVTPTPPEHKVDPPKGFAYTRPSTVTIPGDRVGGVKADVRSKGKEEDLAAERDEVLKLLKKPGS